MRLPNPCIVTRGSLWCSLVAFASTYVAAFELTEKDYFAGDGADLIVFSSWNNGLFSDEKVSGLELIHFGERVATNGDVRLNRTPEQWDPIPTFVERRIRRDEGVIEAVLGYPSHDFEYTLRVAAQDDGSFRVGVWLEKPLPAALVGRAALHLEFLPSAFWGKAYQADAAMGQLPHYPSSEMSRDPDGRLTPEPLASGRRVVLAAGDAHARVSVESLLGGEVALFDGRNLAQNGWFVVQTLLPEERTGEVVAWRLQPAQEAGWKRAPVIAHSQVGYPSRPDARRVATIELDAKDTPGTARLLRIEPEGQRTEVLRRELELWGKYQRYHYAVFDFSAVAEPGLYVIDYEGLETEAFPIGPSVYGRSWQPTLDVYFPVQMDHMHVNEAYRVWHGAAHLDDALQAPVDYEHFDLYAQGPTTDTPYAPGEHIPGLNYGGWFDAGDFDIRTQTQSYVLRNLVATWEFFRPERDETLIDEARRYVDLHHPDGRPDLLQQIEHGALALLAQHRAVGHAIPGIVAATLLEYTHIGDASTKTDGLIHDPTLGADEETCTHSGRPDDRWAFTSRSSALNLGSAGALAASSRALRGYDEPLAEECLETALRVWDEEAAKAEPDRFHHGNTTGGRLEDERILAAAELYLATREGRFLEAVEAGWPTIDEVFWLHAPLVSRVLDDASETFRARVEARTRRYLSELDAMTADNPFGVVITEGGWAGSGYVVGAGVNAYYLHRAFPEIVPASAVDAPIQFIHGNHPDHNLSLVSGIGARTKKVAYGNNRADFSYIAGGVVPGVLIIPPDFPENMEDWPFFWGENEYVVSVGSSYLFLALAADELAREAVAAD